MFYQNIIIRTYFCCYYGILAILIFNLYSAIALAFNTGSANIASTDLAHDRFHHVNLVVYIFGYQGESVYISGVIQRREVAGQWHAMLSYKGAFSSGILRTLATRSRHIRRIPSCYHA